jgi:N-acetyltransferase 10
MSTTKKVDARIRTLIENGVKTQHRSMFVLVGDHGKDQVGLPYRARVCVLASRKPLLLLGGQFTTTNIKQFF